MSSSNGEKITWLSLPRKDQLFVLCLARFVEPVVSASIVTYIYYQLQGLDPTLSPPEVVAQMSYLNSGFQLAQCFSILFIGKVADATWGGRKRVLLMGTGGLCITCVAFGFVQNFQQALALRISEGLFNGNLATIRTMVLEVVKEKRLQPRAFALLPVAFNLAILSTPFMSGRLADLAGRYPEKLGHVDFLVAYPYAAPALMNGCLLGTAFLAIFFLLEETLEPIQGRYDIGLETARMVRSWLFGCSRRGAVDYRRLAQHPEGSQDQSTTEAELSAVISPGTSTPTRKDPPKAYTNFLPLRRILTKPLGIALVTIVITEAHTVAYNTLLPGFLATPVATAAQVAERRLPFRFTGGAGFSTDEIGYTFAMLGIFGFVAQLGLYPSVQQRLGTMGVWRGFLFGLPFVYLLASYISVLPSSSPPPAGKTGWVVWAYITLVQCSMMLCAVFVMPSQILIINSNSPHPSARGRTQSLAVLFGALSRAPSASLNGILYGYGMVHNIAGLAWWIASFGALCGWFVSLFATEGSGHLIKLEGDDES